MYEYDIDLYNTLGSALPMWHDRAILTRKFSRGTVARKVSIWHVFFSLFYLNAFKIIDPTFLKNNPNIQSILPHFNILVSEFSHLLECEKDVLFGEIRKIFEIGLAESIFLEDSKTF